MAPLYYHGNVQPPRSVAEIVKEAEDYDHKGEYPLRIALRAAQSIRNQAANYERDGNVQDAYLFYYRHISFYQAQIHKHPEVKKPEYKQALARIRQEFKDDIARLEALKPEVNKQYERYQEALRRREESRTKVRQERESHIESQRISARNSLDGTDGTRYEHSAGYGGRK
ncbi:hypothetical protein H2203_007598 [Taxawa tesnikishii (nom. ined.)]|nr:hypothetical protein H2203_007598 [Dothideales sp. JES 119]